MVIVHRSCGAAAPYLCCSPGFSLRSITGVCLLAARQADEYLHPLNNHSTSGCVHDQQSWALHLLNSNFAMWYKTCTTGSATAVDRYTTEAVVLHASSHGLSLHCDYRVFRLKGPLSVILRTIRNMTHMSPACGDCTAGMFRLQVSPVRRFRLQVRGSVFFNCSAYQQPQPVHTVHVVRELLRERTGFSCHDCS